MTKEPINVELKKCTKENKSMRRKWQYKKSREKLMLEAKRSKKLELRKSTRHKLIESSEISKGKLR